MNKLKRGTFVVVIILSGALVLGVLLAVSRGSSEGVKKTSMNGELRVVGVDVNDSAAMARWAHGLCHGQTVEHLAEIYEVEPTMNAVVERLSRYLPKEVQGAVARACETELKRTEAKT